MRGSSYRLDEIGEFEVGEKKVEYEGTLNDLYENDIDKFVQYNLQDVKLVKRIDDKLNFIEIGRGIHTWVIVLMRMCLCHLVI